MNIKSTNPMSIKPLTNIGALMDIPTGTFITGERGERILNGGAAAVTAVAGLGNMFKSTLMHFIAMKSSDTIAYSTGKAMVHTYDTEDNMIFNLDRINKLTSRMKSIPKDPLYDDDVWSFISKSDMSAEDWIETVHKSVKEKVKDKKSFITYHGYINRITGKPLVLPYMSSIGIDSFSELEGSKTQDTVADGNINSSNTMFMAQGLLRTKVMKDLPTIAVKTNTNFYLTAHVGEVINMASGPFAPQPVKQMQHMNANMKVKGVTGKLFYLSTHFYFIMSARALINSNTKMPEYPDSVNDNSTDLNIIKFKTLRSKTGPSGHLTELIVSQVEGVLPELSEFHYIKTNKFGLVGSVQNYAVAVYPDVKISRTTVRKKIDEDAKLRRAIGIVSDMLQMRTFMKQYKDLECEPEELYNDIKELGYDWDFILENTRRWYTPNQYTSDLLFLSTLDLLRIRKKLYTPYWFKKRENSK